MKEWLQENPNGSKGAFEKYFKGLSADVRKVCDRPSHLSALNLLGIQVYKDQANAAVSISFTHTSSPPNSTDITTFIWVNRQRHVKERIQVSYFVLWDHHHSLTTPRTGHEPTYARVTSCVKAGWEHGMAVGSGSGSG